MDCSTPLKVPGLLGRGAPLGFDGCRDGAGAGAGADVDGAVPVPFGFVVPAVDMMVMPYQSIGSPSSWLSYDPCENLVGF